MFRGVDQTGWIHATHQTGTFLVHSGHQWIPVQISQVCSGADSLIAMVLFLPIVLAFFDGAVRTKLGLLLGVAVSTIVLNLLRLEVIIGLLHWTGPRLALDIVHPVLGFVLLLALLAAIFKAAELSPLQFRVPPWTDHLALPHWPSWAVALATGGVLWTTLLPLSQLSAGTPLHPVTVRTVRLNRILPAISGSERAQLLRQSEAAILGPRSQTLAVLYQQGAQSVMAEVWRTSEPLVLAGLGGRNCLLFHGNRVLRESPVPLFDGISGTAFVLVTPSAALGGAGNEYLDVEYTVSTRSPSGKPWYFRVELAAQVGRDVHPGSQTAQSIASATMQRLSLNHGHGALLPAVYRHIEHAFTIQ